MHEDETDRCVEICVARIATTLTAPVIERVLLWILIACSLYKIECNSIYLSLFRSLSSGRRCCSRLFQIHDHRTMATFDAEPLLWFPFRSGTMQLAPYIQIDFKRNRALK